MYVKVYQNVHFNYVLFIPPLSGLKKDNLGNIHETIIILLVKWNPDKPHSKKRTKAWQNYQLNILEAPSFTDDRRQMDDGEEEREREGGRRLYS